MMGFIMDGTHAFGTSDLEQSLKQSPGNAVEMAAFGLRSDMAQTYQVLPARMLNRALSDSSIFWRIELVFEKLRVTVGCDLLGDAILGRGESADIDLSAFAGADLGVSRQHLLLRPSAQHLYIVDMESTNGVHINGMRLGRNEARAVHDGFMFSLGLVHFTLRVVDHSTIGRLRNRVQTERANQPGANLRLRGGLASLVDDPDTDITLRPEGQGTPDQVEAWLSARYFHALRTLDRIDKEQ